jgi:hypothetical protein
MTIWDWVMLIGISPKTNIHIEWVKLEVGDHFTGFMYEDPATAMMRCRRYFRREMVANSVFIADTGQVSVAVDSSGMRIKPYITNVGIIYLHPQNGTAPVSVAAGGTWDMVDGHYCAAAQPGGTTAGVIYQANSSSATGNRISYAVPFDLNARI